MAEPTTSLLATKLFIPPARPALVVRPRLLERLRTAFDCGLVLISAPAGFGKTTLVSQWIHIGEVPAAWVSLEEAENDPVRFWDYVIAAMKRISPTVGEASLPLLHASTPVPTESVLTALVNEVASVSDGFIVVLDDYHFIEAEAVHKGVTFLLDHLPHAMHVVIATRVDPPLPLGRFRGKGTMLEIRASDLRFNDEEAKGLLEKAGAPGLTAADVETLNARTEGWAVGLKMAALCVPAEKDVAAFVSRFAGNQSYIMDYFIEDVLARLPAETQDFLITTSVLERLSAPLCDSVTGRNDSKTMLTDVERSNLFIVPLDSSREWYRYHHLFRDLLLHRLRARSTDTVIRDLEINASRWYEARGLSEDAIGHALKARSWERVLDLVAAIKPNPLLVYGAPTIYRWLRPIPREVLVTRGLACGHYTWALLMTGQLAAATAFLDSFGELGEPWAGPAAVCRAQIAYFSGDPRIEEHARKALSLLPPDDAFNRAIVCSALGAHYIRRTRLNDAEPLLKEAYEYSLSAGLNVSQILTWLATAVLLRGRLRQAEDMFRSAIRMAERHPNTAHAHLWLSAILYQHNNLGESDAELEKAIALRPGIPDLLLNIHLQAVRNCLARGNVAAAGMALAEAELVAQGDPARQGARIAAWHVALAAVEDDAAAVSQWLDRFLEYGDLSLFHTPARIVPLLHERSSETSRHALEAARQRFHREGLQTILVEVRIAQALISSSSQEALSALGDALIMAKPEGYVRSFADFGLSLAPLLRRAIRAGIEPEYARQLLHVIETDERQRRIERGDRSPSAATTLLSERELEVLRLLAEGLSNQQIAVKLIISLHTAKTHVRHVFDKLGVGGRTQAIARARDLNLL